MLQVALIEHRIPSKFQILLLYTVEGSSVYGHVVRGIPFHCELSGSPIKILRGSCWYCELIFWYMFGIYTKEKQTIPHNNIDTMHGNTQTVT